MMRRNAFLLLSLAAAALAVSGCSPFQAKVHRRDLSPPTSQPVQPASHVAADTTPQTSAGLASLPWKSTTSRTADDEKISQWIALARLSERRDQAEQAEHIYNQILDKVPDHPLPYHRLAVMRAKQSRFDEAEQLFAKAYELSPSDSTLLRDIGYFYYLRSDSERAEQFLLYALKINPDNKAAANNLAILLGEQGRFDEARSYFRRAGNEAQTEANMAFVYAQRGEMLQAVDAYSRALTADNTLRPAAHGLLRIAQLQERFTSTNSRSASPPEQAEPLRAEVTDLSSATPRLAKPNPARQPFTPAVIAYGDEAAAVSQPATDIPEPGPQPRKGLLASLSDFAASLSAPADHQSAPETNAESQATAVAANSTPGPDEDSLRKDTMRALFVAPDNGDGQLDSGPPPAETDSAVCAGQPDAAEAIQPTTQPAPQSPSSVAAASPEPKSDSGEQAAAAGEDSVVKSDDTGRPSRGYLAPKASRVQQRLMALRAEKPQGEDAQPQMVTPPPAAPPAELTATQTAPNDLRPTAVSVRISDVTDEPANKTSQIGNGESPSSTHSSRRRVSRASYTPSNQNGKQGAISQPLSVTTAELRDVPEQGGETSPAADAPPKADDSVQDFLDNWLDLKTPQASAPTATGSSLRWAKP